MNEPLVARPPEVAARTTPGLIVAALWLLNFTTSAQVLIVAPILPRVEEQLSVDPAWLGVIITAYAASMSVFALVAGPISDRFGRRTILLVGAAWMTLALVAHVFATSLGTLVAVRAVAGAASGLLSGATVAYVGDWFPYDRRGWANGWIASGFAAGQIVGVPLGAVLATGSFRTPFLLFAITTAVASFIVYRYVPQPPVKLAAHLSIGRSLRTYAGLLTERATAGTAVAYGLMFFGISAFITYLPAWLETTFDASGPAVATLFLTGGIANLLVGPFAGRLSDRVGRKPIVVGASALFGLMLCAVPFLTVSFTVAYPVFFTVMVFVALRLSPLQSLISALVGPDRRGALLSLDFAVGQAGFALGSWLAAPLYTSDALREAWQAATGIGSASAGFASNSVLAGVSALAMAGVVAWWLPEPDAESAH